jgi:hypothetical protein
MREGSPGRASTLEAWVDTDDEDANSLEALLSNRSVTDWTREDWSGPNGGWPPVGIHWTPKRRVSRH